MLLPRGAKEAGPASLHLSTRGLSLARGAVLVILFTAAAARESVACSSLLSKDVWWHLSAGLWLLQHHAIPHNGIFSQYPERSWIASSWAYEAILAAAYKVIGLRAIPILLMLMKAAFAVATFLLAGGLRGRFWTAALLSAVAQCALPGLDPPPAIFSIILFGAECSLLYKSWDSGNQRPLFYLPVLFLFWVNLHVQFVIGLAAFAFFLAAVAIKRFWHSSRRQQLDRSANLASLGVPAGAFLASIAACLLNPAGFRIFAEAGRDLYGATAFQYLPEMHAMRFRQPQEFVLMLFVMIAFVGIGRKRSSDPLKLGLLLIATLAALRITRDGWIAVMTALIVSAAILNQEGSKELPQPRWLARGWQSLWAVGLGVVLILGVFAARIPTSSVLMTKHVAQQFPVQACDFIRQNRLPRPMFNEYDWGGFLTWYLPEYPVAMDRRLGLYGSELTDNYFQVVQGTDVNAASSFNDARILLFAADSGVARALTTFPSLSSHYRVLYSDRLAIVLERL